VAAVPDVVVDDQEVRVDRAALRIEAADQIDGAVGPGILLGGRRTGTVRDTPRARAENVDVHAVHLALAHQLLDEAHHVIAPLRARAQVGHAAIGENAALAIAGVRPQRHGAVVVHVKRFVERANVVVGATGRIDVDEHFGAPGAGSGELRRIPVATAGYQHAGRLTVQRNVGLLGE